MSLRIIIDSGSGQTVFACTTSDVAFGPLMDSELMARAFEKSLGADPRSIDVDELVSKWGDFQRTYRHCPDCESEIVRRDEPCCDDCAELRRLEGKNV